MASSDQRYQETAEDSWYSTRIDCGKESEGYDERFEECEYVIERGGSVGIYR